MTESNLPRTQEQRRIEAGDLVVLPTDTVYGIAADAFKAAAVQRLLAAKGRGRDMPPPVLISVVESLDALATDIPEAGRKLCENTVGLLEEKGVASWRTAGSSSTTNTSAASS